MTSAKSIRLRRLRNWVVVSALVVLLCVVLVGYPRALETFYGSLGVRGTALSLLALSLVSLLTPRIARVGSGGAFALILPVLLAAAVLTSSQALLRCVPAVVYGTLAAVCAASLRRPDSLIEQGARWLVPEVPDFVRPYCRAVTALWGVFFAVSALVVVALHAHVEAWRLFTGQVFGLAVLGLSLVEFFVRKTWFRYYFHGGPVDWVWSRLFPAERTERGRHSLELIEQYRREIARTEQKGNG